MKINILVECPELISSVKIGVLNLLESKEECNVKFKRTSEIVKDDIIWSDIVISVRGCEKASLKVIEAARKARRFTIMFLDDDLANIPLNLESTKYYNDSELKKYIEKVLENSYILWAVNPRIIEKYSKYTIEKKGILAKVCMKVENKIEKIKNKEKTLKILYAGSVDHKNTIKKLINPVIEKFDQEIKDGEISFTFVGANPEIENISYYEYFENYDKYKEFVKNGGFSIGLAPIETTDFYKSKYYNKFLEYTSIGVLGIYTDSEPYNLVVEHNKNGILCKNEIEKWYDEIKNILDNREIVNNMILNAQKDIIENYNENKVQNELFAQIPELLKYKAPIIDRKNVKLKGLKYIFYLERVKLLMRIYGIRSFYIIPYKIVKKMFKIIRKLILEK